LILDPLARTVHEPFDLVERHFRVQLLQDVVAHRQTMQDRRLDLGKLDRAHLVDDTPLASSLYGMKEYERTSSWSVCNWVSVRASSCSWYFRCLRAVKARVSRLVSHALEFCPGLHTLFPAASASFAIACSLSRMTWSWRLSALACVAEEGTHTLLVLLHLVPL
jgi:hypothetical protein